MRDCRIPFFPGSHCFAGAVRVSEKICNRGMSRASECSTPGAELKPPLNRPPRKTLNSALESEQTAAQNRNETGLTPQNYKFSLIGNTSEDGRQLYILQVEPRVNRKLLYRGKIWVDAQDYAVVRVEAQPAENPSFWIRSTDIHHVYTKVNDFWLPQRNVSQSKIRFGGSATLTIDYSDYKFQGPEMPSAQASPDALRSPEVK